MRYSDDPLFKSSFKYGTHADVLSNHKGFNWVAASDKDQKNLDLLSRKWALPGLYQDYGDMIEKVDPEVLVIATGPDLRINAIRGAKSLRAVLCEKPLGFDSPSAAKLVSECRSRGILLQVNYLRRADVLMRSLADGGIKKLIGEVRTANAGYGNGLMNNGSHIIDLFRMILGDISEIKLADRTPADKNTPIKGDHSYHFQVKMASGVLAFVNAFDFEKYREVFWNFWGDEGRLSIYNGGLLVKKYPRQAHRTLSGEYECPYDNWEDIQSTIGTAFYEMYENLYMSMLEGAELFSTGDNAIKTESAIDMLHEQLKK